MREIAVSPHDGRRTSGEASTSFANRIGVVAWGVQSWFFCGLALNLRPSDGWNAVVALCLALALTTSALAFREHRRTRPHR